MWGGGGGFNIPAYPRHKKEEEHISKWTSDLKEVQNWNNRLVFPFCLGWSPKHNKRQCYKIIELLQFQISFACGSSWWLNWFPLFPCCRLLNSLPHDTHTRTHTHTHTHTQTHKQTYTHSYIHTHNTNTKLHTHTGNQPLKDKIWTISHTPLFTVTQNAFKVSQNWIWPTFELKYFCKFTKNVRKSLQNRIMNTCL